MVLAGGKQWEDQEMPKVSLEDHLLERITNIEDTLNSVLDHLSYFSTSLESNERNAFVTRAGLASLIEILKEAQVVDSEPLHQRWESTMWEQMEEARIQERFMAMKNRFQALYRGKPEKKNAFLARIEESEFLMFSDRLEESTAALKKAFVLDKRNYELAYYLAELAHENGELTEAKKYLELGLKANASHKDSLVFLALLHHGEGRVAQAKELLLRAHHIDPEDDLPLLCVGAIFSAEGEYREAEVFLKLASEIAPQAQTHYLLGVGAKEMGRIKDATRHLVQATELDPQHEDAVFALGMVYLSRGWTRKAQRCFTRALDLNPKKLEFREALQLSQSPLKEQQLDLDSEGLERFRQAEDLLNAGKYKQALSLYRKLMRRYPDNVFVLSSCAVVNFSLRRYEDTLATCQKVLSRDAPPMVVCVGYTLQMESLRALGRFPEAIAQLEEMVVRFPDGFGRVVANYGLALTLADTGQDLRRAETLARESVESAPDEFKHYALDALAWVYYKQSRYEEALELLEQALEIEGNVNHMYHYGMVLMALNLLDEAFAVFERAVKSRHSGPKVDEFIFSAIRREMKRLDSKRKSTSAESK